MRSLFKSIFSVKIAFIIGANFSWPPLPTRALSERETAACGLAHARQLKGGGGWESTGREERKEETGGGKNPRLSEVLLRHTKALEGFLLAHSPIFVPNVEALVSKTQHLGLPAAGTQICALFFFFLMDQLQAPLCRQLASTVTVPTPEAHWVFLSWQMPVLL